MSKYHAKPTIVDGIRFASKLEARRYQELKLLEYSGKISGLKTQHVMPIVINGLKICNYIADFLYKESEVEIVEDTKGVLTPVFKLKKKLVKALYGIDILVTGAK